MPIVLLDGLSFSGLSWMYKLPPSIHRQAICQYNLDTSIWSVWRTNINASLQLKFVHFLQNLSFCFVKQNSIKQTNLEDDSVL
jgi:hypothetical protein